MQHGINESDGNCLFRREIERSWEVGKFAQELNTEVISRVGGHALSLSLSLDSGKVH